LKLGSIPAIWSGAIPTNPGTTTLELVPLVIFPETVLLTEAAVDDTLLAIELADDTALLAVSVIFEATLLADALALALLAFFSVFLGIV
jgi:hypothetical protein